MNFINKSTQISYKYLLFLKIKPEYLNQTNIPANYQLSERHPKCLPGYLILTSILDNMPFNTGKIGRFDVQIKYLSKFKN